VLAVQPRLLEVEKSRVRGDTNSVLSAGRTAPLICHRVSPVGNFYKFVVFPGAIYQSNLYAGDRQAIDKYKIVIARVMTLVMRCKDSRQTPGRTARSFVKY
jgi:hypothetical protein